MFKLIHGLRPDVLGVEACGQVTHQDYHDILVPKAEAMMAKGPVKLLYVVGADFTGYELEALWDDGAFGFKHWQDFRRIALVSDLPWLRATFSMFAPLFPAEARLFKLSELAAAKAWIAS